MNAPLIIHWFRRDLRLDDNSALIEALSSGAQVVPLFILDPVILHGERAGAARTHFMLKGLAALDAQLRALGAGLLMRQGDAREVLPALAHELGAQAVSFNVDLSPYAARRDEVVTRRLAEIGVEVRSFDDLLLLAPGEVVKADGSPFVVFSPFRRAWDGHRKREPAALPPDARFFLPPGDRMPVPTLADLNLPGTIEVPEAGEVEALRRLEAFIDEHIEQYAEGRNQIASLDGRDIPLGTSALSPYLHLGMLSPRRAYHAASEAWQRARAGTPRHGAETWINELCWRDFYNHILYHFPHVLERSYRPEYDRLEFRHAPDDLARWQEGQTGYPIIDAAMRSVNALGWMHNRARMIVASFLTKDLLINFREGDVYFMRTLIDGDLAANNGGWQWVAGTGTDPQPYFRIFNPVTQSQRFDPDGTYIRRWVPELRDLSSKQIHWPHDMAAPPPGYPSPIVDHSAARERTLAAFKAVKMQNKEDKEMSDA